MDQKINPYIQKSITNYDSFLPSLKYIICNTFTEYMDLFSDPLDIGVHLKFIF